MRTSGRNLSPASQQRWVLALTSVASLMVGLDILVVTTALTTIRLRLGASRCTPDRDRAARPADQRQRELADRYVTAFVHADVDGLTRLLADEVVLEMPPFLAWFRGRESVSAFLAGRALAAPDRWRAIPVGANGQPAMGAYLRRDDGRHHAHSVQVFDVSEGGLAWIAAFQDRALFGTFGLPPVYPVLRSRQAADALDVAGQDRRAGRIRDHHGAAPPDQQGRSVLGGQVAAPGGDHEHAVALRQMPADLRVDPFGDEERVGFAGQQRADGAVQRPAVQFL